MTIPTNSTRTVKEWCLMRRLNALLATSLFCLFPQVASAQYWGWGGGYGNYATSGAEAQDDGISNVIRAEGKYKMDSAEANKEQADASIEWSAAREDKAQTYFQMREMNEQFVAHERSLQEHSTMQQDIRHAEELVPPKSTATQLDPVTGKINWPPIMQTPEYQPLMQQLDQLFEQRAHTGGGLGTPNYDQITSVGNELTAKIKGNIRNMSTSDYLTIRDFVSSLVWTARSPN